MGRARDLEGKVARRKIMEDLDMINRLPDDCMNKIFSFILSLSDRRSCAAVSKRWLRIQSQMKISHHTASPSELLSRKLQGTEANDMRLAALAVNTKPPHILTDLCVSQSSPHHGITDQGLQTIIEASPSLKSLTLQFCTWIGNRSLESLAAHCKDLDKLELIDTPFIDDKGLLHIAVSCMLKSIFLESCLLVGDPGLISLITHRSNPTQIKLVNMNMGDATLRAMGDPGVALQVLHLESISGPTELGYSWLGEVEKLEILTLLYCRGLTGTSFMAMSLNSFVSLKVIEVGHCEFFTDAVVIRFSKLARRLKSLKLKSCNGFTCEGLMKALENWRVTLKVLILEECFLVKNYECPPMIPESYPSLEILKVNQCGGAGDYFLSSAGPACKEARYISLAGMDSVTGLGLIGLLIHLSGPYYSLRELDLSGCTGISETSIREAVNAFGRTIEVLKVGGCVGVTDWSLAVIGQRCKRLAELDVGGCGIGDAGMKRLVKARWNTLKRLTLAGCLWVSDKSLTYMKERCWKLRWLCLKNCPHLSWRAIISVRRELNATVIW